MFDTPSNEKGGLNAAVLIRNRFVKSQAVAAEALRRPYSIQGADAETFTPAASRTYRSDFLIFNAIGSIDFAAVGWGEARRLVGSEMRRVF